MKGTFPFHITILFFLGSFERGVQSALSAAHLVVNISLLVERKNEKVSVANAPC